MPRAPGGPPETARVPGRIVDLVERAPVADAVGLSRGVASGHECEGIASGKDLFASADAALYEIKRAGGGGVAVAPPRAMPAVPESGAAANRSPRSRSPRDRGGR